MTSARPLPKSPRTLAAERTMLAWDRTTLAVLGNGSLLLVRHLRGAPGPTLFAAVVALVVMLVVGVLGRRRARRLHDPTRRAAVAREPAIAGVGVVLVGVCVLIALVLGAFGR